MHPKRRPLLKLFKRPASAWRRRSVCALSFCALSIETLEDRRVLAYAHVDGGFEQGLLHTEADFDRMATKVAEQAEPWYSGYQSLINHGYSQLGADPRPLETVIRGGAGQNFNQMVIDIQRAYQLALRWKVTGDTAYADKAVEFLNAWQYTMTTLTGNADRFLAAGIYGYEWANVAEIMRTYDGWAEDDAENFGGWLVEHFYQKNHDFLVNHNTAAITNYWANWDLCNIASMMAIGVYTDNQAIYDEAVDYLYHGGGNGALDKFVYYVHDGNLGQWQEAGRDQGHTTLGVSLAGPILQMAWNQGLDLYAYDNNRFLAGAEYVAKYNLGEDVPYTTYSWGTGQSGAWQTQTVVSAAGRGNGRAGYELVYNHYANRMGIATPYSEERVDLYQPEGDGGNGDQFGFGTLTYTLDPFPVENSKPSGLTAVNYDGTVKLNWWGAVYADSHNVYRATSEGGPFELIASGVTDLMTFADHGMPAGEYFYKVTGVIDGAETAASDVVRIDTSPELVAHLTFDDGSGGTATDATGNGTNGVLEGGATWTTGVDGGAVDLSGGGQYVELPENVMESHSDYTIVTWVHLDSNSNWARLFDFGNSDGRYMFLTPQASSGKVRFAVATVFGYNENVIEGDSALPTGEWVHVAVTQSGQVGKLYVNGEVVGVNDDMPQNAFQLGSTSQNWIGRSQYPDPYLNGRVDDFRIYSGALGAAAVYELATGAEAPAAPNAPATLDATPQAGAQAALSWASGGRGVDYYTVKRADNAGGPYYTVAVVSAGLSYTDTGLTAGQEYFYAVVSNNEGGASTPSPVASVTALPPLPGTPVGVSANAASATEIGIAWSAASDAAGYAIARSETSGGPYAILASGVTDTSYVDNTVSTGKTYYYIVTAVNAAGESVPSAEVSASASDLVGWWRLDETDGAVAADSSGAGRDATLVGGSWVGGRIEGAVSLDGADDYVDLPDGIVGGLTDFSVSLWARSNGDAAWSRLFDFGAGTDNYMFLTPVNGSDGDLRFAIKAGGGEEQVNTSANLSTRGWSHVVVTMEGGVGVLYLNGVEVGRNSSMTLTPSDLGLTTQNYVGRSQFPDPYFGGTIDDFRLLNRALSLGEIQAMRSPSDLPGDYNADGAVNAADYSLWRDALGSSSPAFTGADGDGDGRVAHADYDLWRSNYGATATAAIESLLLPALSASDAVGELTGENAVAQAVPPRIRTVLSQLSDWQAVATQRQRFIPASRSTELPATAAARVRSEQLLVAAVDAALSDQERRDAAGDSSAAGLSAVDEVEARNESLWESL